MADQDIRRWVEARRAAEAFELREAPPALDPQASWRHTLDLMALLGRMVGWPVPEDEVRRRENEAAAAAWDRLRRHYGVPR